MPGIQEIIALGIVALVVWRLIWRRRNSSRKAGACGDCASSGPPPKESTVRFYRRQPDSDQPTKGPPDLEA